MPNTIMEALRDYFLACPLMGNRKINVDFLPDNKREYSIDTTPATEVVKWYVGGGTIRQYLFVIRSVEDYAPDVLQNLANSGFYENLAAWMEQQTRAGNLPILPDGKEAQKIEAQSTGYLFTTGPDVGKYQIQCRLQYYQEA